LKEAHNQYINRLRTRLITSRNLLFIWGHHGYMTVGRLITKKVSLFIKIIMTYYIGGLLLEVQAVIGGHKKIKEISQHPTNYKTNNPTPPL
jgi:hypothetical protein